jgi:hypothetical protein
MINEIYHTPDEQVYKRVKGIADDQETGGISAFLFKPDVKPLGEESILYPDDQRKNKTDQYKSPYLCIQGFLQQVDAVDHHAHQMRENDAKQHKNGEATKKHSVETLEACRKKGICQDKSAPTYGLKQPVFRNALEKTRHK